MSQVTFFFLLHEVFFLYTWDIVVNHCHLSVILELNKY